MSTTSTLSRRENRESQLHPATRMRRLQQKGAVVVHRHALPSIAVSLGLGLVAGLAVGSWIASTLEARRIPESFLRRSRRRMGSALSRVAPKSFRSG